jgi:hypothetical protein
MIQILHFSGLITCSFWTWLVPLLHFSDPCNLTPKNNLGFQRYTQCMICWIHRRNCDIAPIKCQKYQRHCRPLIQSDFFFLYKISWIVAAGRSGARSRSARGPNWNLSQGGVPAHVVCGLPWVTVMVCASETHWHGLLCVCRAYACTVLSLAVGGAPCRGTQAAYDPYSEGRQTRLVSPIQLEPSL